VRGSRPGTRPGINTLIVVPSSTRGGQMVAFQELLDALR
jgi:hypothetical protein